MLLFWGARGGRRGEGEGGGGRGGGGGGEGGRGEGGEGGGGRGGVGLGLAENSTTPRNGDAWCCNHFVADCLQKPVVPGTESKTMNVSGWPASVRFDASGFA